MKYIITGSLGHISRPVTAALAAAGHDVTVISSQPERIAEIESVGASAAIGSLTDFSFVQETFGHADAVYLMIPPNFSVEDFPAYQRQVADHYVAALRSSSVKHIVLLSSIGAHLRQGAGPIDALGYLEEQLQSLQDRHIKILRPAFFYYNLLGMAGLLKTAGIIGSNFGSSDEKIALVHHLDIADRVVHHLLHPHFEGYSIEYVASDERSAPGIASVLGQAAGKKNAAWVSFSDEQSYEAMVQQGLGPSLAKEYIEMGQAFREGRAQQDYWAHRPELAGSRRLEAFAGEFARVYQAIPEPALQA
ncbi:MAG: NAD(P)H-binding protein [Chitinophagaceae bacterium]